MPGTTFSAANWGGYDSASFTAAASVTGFSLLVDISNLSSTFGSSVQSDGADIRVTKSDGTTELAYQLIDWAYNAGSPTGYLRILFSGASGTSANTVRIWADYTPGTATAYDATETYGSDNAYDANWLRYYAEDGTDRTSNGDDLTTVGSPGTTTGQIGTAMTFPTSSDYFHETAAAVRDLPTTHDFTILCWFDPTTSEDDLNEYSWQGTDDLGVGLNSTRTGSGDQRIFWRDIGQLWSVNGSDLSSSGWHHHGFVSRASNDHEGYTDGSSVATSTGSGTTGPFTEFFLGRGYVGNTSICNINEFQIHDVARSDAWISEEYDQTNNNATYWTTWAWTSTGGGGVTIKQGLHRINDGVVRSLHAITEGAV